jgi:hypothetical protein
MLGKILFHFLYILINGGTPRGNFRKFRKKQKKGQISTPQYLKILWRSDLKEENGSFQLLI